MDDYDARLKEALDLIDEEELYWQQNDAKFRAVRQGASYEQFQAMVNTAHLRPVNKTDRDSLFSQETSRGWKQRQKPHHRYDRLPRDKASATGSRDSKETGERGEAAASRARNKPKRSEGRFGLTFQETWRHLTAQEDREQLLIQETSRAASPPPAEIEADLLAQMMEVLLLSCCREEPAGSKGKRSNEVLDCLEAIGKSRRFGLQLLFAQSSGFEDNISSIFEFLEKEELDENSKKKLEALQTVYKVK